jgi:hypothetical protein
LIELIVQQFQFRLHVGTDQQAQSPSSRAAKAEPAKSTGPAWATGPARPTSGSTTGRLSLRPDTKSQNQGSYQNGSVANTSFHLLHPRE